MSNRSYLYASNLIPGHNVKKEDLKIVGISEWSNDIPIVFKLLLSGNPIACPSLICDSTENIAIVGDFKSGLERLTIFLKQIDLKEAQPFIEEALEFLNSPENQNQYFLLECAEIFMLTSESPFKQNSALLKSINNLEPEMQKALKSLLPTPEEEPKPLGFFAKIFGKKPKKQKFEKDNDQPIYDLGLGFWDNILYYDLSGE